MNKKLLSEWLDITINTFVYKYLLCVYYIYTISNKHSSIELPPLYNKAFLLDHSQNNEIKEHNIVTKFRKLTNMFNKTIEPSTQTPINSHPSYTILSYIIMYYSAI